ncbi:YciI family protein [Streptomyces sp. NPDC056716]|uniref:YciI family protein n=1 Tax=unclassified Streptomyces TaxID=2593676 RepID=UPI00368A6468
MATMPWDELVQFCRQLGQNLIGKELYVVFSDPVDGLDPVLKNLEPHLAYQIKLQDDGVMFAAGPLSSEGGTEYNGHGVFVYHAESIDDATRIAASDPMHQAGARTFRVLPWLLNEGTLRA